MPIARPFLMFQDGKAQAALDLYDRGLARGQRNSARGTVALFLTERRAVPELTAEGHGLVERLSLRHGFGEQAVTQMLSAVLDGNGTQAQFAHPEFGGSGQWMRGGMIMLGDMFAHQLKGRVDALCNDIADTLASTAGSFARGSYQSQRQSGSDTQRQTAGGPAVASTLFVADPEQTWWPESLGVPDATGSQNDMHYALFGGARRLAVKTGRHVWVYDTQEHRIGGFSQQQGPGSSITFTSQFGTVSLASLPVVTIDGRAPAPRTADAPAPRSSGDMSGDSGTPAPTPAQQPTIASATADSRLRDAEAVLVLLQRLGELHAGGVLTDNEFAQKKAELLQRL